MELILKVKIDKGHMENLITVREVQEEDHPFILGLSPHLAEVAQLDWHIDLIAAVINPLFIFGKQRHCLHDYIAKTKVSNTYT